ncbi:mannitol dehydrogenase family protein [Alteromonas sp. C1M14]|uniref:mannitol dehydrogenase family protein n=1 Tax=Alteromonas sp. C1M14 TaxID=2841567 RepID=UPI001C0A3830|nr:mannitol dehydrogenase family protein [Alteromonas sp. C1M14]MBU2978577.1 mannitol dehydrogenase family protein [Alteromonas sp. C1M14]
MDRLSRQTLVALPSEVETPNYGKADISAGIVHFGVGNFHRAHQAAYFDTLLNAGEKTWGIVGVSMRSARMRDNLAPQDYLYTLAEVGEQTQLRVVGAIQTILVAPQTPQDVINAVAQATTELVTTTITEKGYCLGNGKVDDSHPDISHDLTSLEAPKTTYGFLAAALIKRHQSSGQPLTILCCDNLNSGGERLREGVALMLAKHGPDTQRWVNEQVAFASSMVDRVTPATDDALVNQLSPMLTVHDAAPVSAEPFTQWIIEDNFAGKKPPLEQAGALFVSDISAFEKVKLRFLNASHSMLAMMGYLMGDDYIHEAVARPLLARFADEALRLNVLPVTHVPSSISGDAYIEDVFTRFRNHHLPYRVLQVGSDSSQKIQQRWFPAIDDGLNQQADVSYLAFALAAWACFVDKAVKNNVLNDPQKEPLSAWVQQESGDIANLLTIAEANKFGFYEHKGFMEQAREYQRSIAASGIEAALKTFFNSLK